MTCITGGSGGFFSRFVNVSDRCVFDEPRSPGVEQRVLGRTTSVPELVRAGDAMNAKVARLSGQADDALKAIRASQTPIAERIARSGDILSGYHDTVKAEVDGFEDEVNKAYDPPDSFDFAKQSDVYSVGVVYDALAKTMYDDFMLAVVSHYDALAKTASQDFRTAVYAIRAPADKEIDKGFASKDCQRTVDALTDFDTAFTALRTAQESVLGEGDLANEIMRAGDALGYGILSDKKTQIVTAFEQCGR